MCVFMLMRIIIFIAGRNILLPEKLERKGRKGSENLEECWDFVKVCFSKISFRIFFYYIDRNTDRSMSSQASVS